MGAPDDFDLLFLKFFEELGFPAPSSETSDDGMKQLKKKTEKITIC